MTKQEMFNRAFLGLKGQGFAQSKYGAFCVYQSPDGKRCAWGHVDPSLTKEHRTGVRGLFEDQIGVAATIDVKDLIFVERLQDAHDRATSPNHMDDNLMMLANQYDLEIP